MRGHMEGQVVFSEGVISGSSFASPRVLNNRVILSVRIIRSPRISSPTYKIGAPGTIGAMMPTKPITTNTQPALFLRRGRVTV